MPLPRLVFYAGAMAMGALEVVEWPVELVILRGGPRPRPDSATVWLGGAAGRED